MAHFSNEEQQITRRESIDDNVGQPRTSQEYAIEEAPGAPPIDRDEVPPIILQFMARSTMKAVMKGDASAFGRVSKAQSVEDVATLLYEKTQRDKRDYVKKLKKDLIYSFFGKVSDTLLMSCFRAFRRNVREVWLQDHPDYLGAPSPEEVEAERLRQEALEKTKAMHNEATERGSISKRRTFGNSRLLDALEEQMAAERAIKAKEGTREAELQAEYLKLLEAQAGGGSRSSINQKLAKLRKELTGLRRGARQEEADLSGAGQQDKAHILKKQRNRQVMLNARGIFDEGGMPDVKLWLELHRRKQLPTLDHAQVEANPEESVNVNEMPLERTLGQPAFVFRRPRSSFAKFYAKASPQRPQTTLPNSLRPKSP